MSAAGPGRQIDKALSQSFGRESAVGRALHFLYGSDVTGRELGNQYSAKNMERPQRPAGRNFQPVASPVMQALPKVAVKVPKCGKKKSTCSKEHAPGRRRTASAILTHQKQLEAEICSAIQTPQRALGDAEKSRLATHMEFRGRPPDIVPREDEDHIVKGRRFIRAQGHESELETLFQDIAMEIFEREEHLDYIRTCGSNLKDSITVRNLQFEIATRSHELQRIHELMLSKQQ